MNAIVGGDGKWRYVDHQNFLLVDYGNYLKKVALESADDSHYGDRSVLRGNRYLYQSVPGVAVPGKRNDEDRVGGDDWPPSLVVNDFRRARERYGRTQSEIVRRLAQDDTL